MGRDPDDISAVGQAVLMPVEMTDERLKELPPFSPELFCKKCVTVMLIPTILAYLKLFDPQKLPVFICPQCLTLYELQVMQSPIVVPKGMK